MFWYFIHKTLNTDIYNYLKMKRYFKCEIKTANRWQQVTVNKWVIAIEPTHLNGWFIQKWNSHVAQRAKTGNTVFKDWKIQLNIRYTLL